MAMWLLLSAGWWVGMADAFLVGVVVPRPSPYLEPSYGRSLVCDATTTSSNDSSAGSSSSSSIAAPNTQLIRVSLTKPMGLILEEMEDDDEDGHANPNDIRMGRTQIVAMSGTAARASQLGHADICIGDTIRAVGDVSCDDWSLDQILAAIGDWPADMPVVLTLERPPGTVAVQFAQTGVAIAATPGTPLCNLALDANVPILYSCRNGACGTCEQMVVVGVDGKEESSSSHYVRPCVDRVPKGVNRIVIMASDRYE